MSAAFGRVFDQIIDHQNIKDHFLKTIISGDLHHCHLFVGQEGIGKKQIAIGVCQEILCLEKKEGLACGFCPHCIRVAKQAHECLLVIEPENQNIKLESAKSIASFLQLGKIGKARVIIIDEVDKMNVQTANALLKTLEEPPEDTYFFLITNNPHKLLPTILSRSQMIRFKPISLDILRSKTVADEWQIKASMGSFAELKKWRENDRGEFRIDLIDWLSSLNQCEYPEIKGKCKEFSSDKETFLTSLSLIQLAVRDALSLRLSSQPPKFFPDRPEKIQSLAEISTEGLQKIFELCCNMEQDLNFNIDRALHLESFALKVSSMLGQK